MQPVPSRNGQIELVENCGVGLTELARKAASLAAEATDHPLLQSLNPESGRYHIVKGWNVGPLEGLEQFGVEVLHEVGLGSTPRHFRSPHGMTAITPYGIAQWVVAQSRSRSADAVLQEFADLVARDSVRYLEIVALWGISPASPIDLGLEGIRLVPIADIPLSDHKDATTDVRIWRMPESGIPLGIRPRATAALVREFDVAPLFLPAGTTKLQVQPALLKRDVMYEIARMLVTAVDAPVIPFAQWTQAVPGTPFIIGGEGGYRATTGFLDRDPEPHVVEPELLRGLVTAYLRIPSERRQKLQVPVSRLNSALVEAAENRVQAFIDLGVAMEAFICPDEAPEITYRFALRGALYLGGPESERVERRQTLKFLYRTRSDAVHTGTLGNLSPDAQVDLLRKGRGDFVAMLRKTIRT